MLATRCESKEGSNSWDLLAIKSKARAVVWGGGENSSLSDGKGRRIEGMRKQERNTPVFALRTLVEQNRLSSSLGPKWVCWFSVAYSSYNIVLGLLVYLQCSCVLQTAGC